MSNEQISLLKNLTEHRIYFNEKGLNLSEEAWENYIKLHFNIVPNLKLILNNSKKQTYHQCTNNDLQLNCIETNFDKKELKKLLSGKLANDKASYQYIGKYENLNILQINNEKNYNKINIQKSNFFMKMILSFSLMKIKKIDIYQKPGSRAFFVNGTLENIEINFHGYNEKITSDIQKYPFDIRGLTDVYPL